MQFLLRKDEPKTDILKLARHLHFETEQQGIKIQDNEDYAKILGWNLEIEFQSMPIIQDYSRHKNTI